MFFSVMTLFSVIMLNDARNCVLMGSGDLCHSVGLETFRQTKKSVRFSVITQTHVTVSIYRTRQNSPISQYVLLNK